MSLLDNIVVEVDDEIDDECYFCGAACDEVLFCYGCSTYICDDCDMNYSLYGAHDRYEHLNDPEDEEEDDLGD